MKGKWIVGALMLCGSLQAAVNKPVGLKCVRGPHSFEFVRVQLDPSVYDADSDLNHVRTASISYNYSNVNNMACVGHIRGSCYKINCAGYYQFDELMELKIRNQGDKIVALWKTSKPYGNQDKVTDCVEVFE